jgi:hypothetical protein
MTVEVTVIVVLVVVVEVVVEVVRGNDLSFLPRQQTEMLCFLAPTDSAAAVMVGKYWMTLPVSISIWATATKELLIGAFTDAGSGGAFPALPCRASATAGAAA